MKKNESELYKFIHICLQAIKTARIPYYSNKFSRIDYTQHQHLAVLLLEKKQRRKYRRLWMISLR